TPVPTMLIDRLCRLGRFNRDTLVSVGYAISVLASADNTFAQETAGVAEMERVIVTGSNIPTAEETGPNPVDTYRPADIEKLGIRNATDLQTFLPQQAGGTTNMNIANGGGGPAQFNPRGLLPPQKHLPCY